MNLNVMQYIRNFSFSIFANVVTLVVSMVTTLLLPKIMSNSDYGYWTLYLLYVSYVGFFHFGWIDGIYLRLGGKSYKHLDKHVLNSQFWLVNAIEFAITVLVCVTLVIVVPNDYKLPVLLLSIFNIIPTIPKTFFLYVLQATNRISEYGKITVIEKMSFCVILVAGLAFGVRNVFVIMIFDILSKFVSLLLSIHYCKDIAFHRIRITRPDFKEAWVNISAGVKLMMANVAGMLMLGIVRLSIENVWDIETFGKVSLVMSVSNLLMVFINAIGIVLFPMLRRTQQDKLSFMYTLMRTILMVFIFSMLIAYFPGRIILAKWLPQYSDSLKYMALMFPICIFEGKMSLLINTYLKTLRKEKIMMVCNFVSVLLTFVITGIVVYVRKDLNLAVLSISFLFAFRSVISELCLSRFMKMNMKSDIILELLMSVAFIVTAWYLDAVWGTIAYLICLIIYFVLKRADILFTFQTFKSIIKSK